MKSRTKILRRPKLPRATEEIKQWSATLGQELHKWPFVRSRPMFGLVAFYRKDAIFAALPVTRGIGAPNLINFKMKSMPPETLRRLDDDRRAAAASRIRAKYWHAFEVNSSDDLRDALWWLSQAYEQAK